MEIKLSDIVVAIEGQGYDPVGGFTSLKEVWDCVQSYRRNLAGKTGFGGIPLSVVVCTTYGCEERVEFLRYPIPS
jgi:hypothetical protein